MSVKVDSRKLDEMIGATPRQVHLLLLDLGGEVVNEAVQIVPVKTGELKNSIGAEFTDEYTIRVKAGWDNGGYAGYVEWGTPPHEIRPKVKKALWWEGADHPVMRVHHPGTPAQPFMKPSLEKVWQKFKAGGYKPMVANRLGVK